MSPTDTFRPAVHRYAVFTACSTVLLLVAGALVTSNDAGLAVPDWPTSFGTFFPPMVGGIFYEHGHRMVATFVGLVTIGLAVILWKSESRRWMRNLGFLALAAVVVQGLFGGLTVLLRLPPAVSIVHATLAQIFFCITVAIAVFTSRWWVGQAPEASGLPVLDEADGAPLRSLSLWLAGVTFVQLTLGAAARHNAFGILPHLVGAAAVLTLAIIVARTVRRDFGNIGVAYVGPGDSLERVGEAIQRRFRATRPIRVLSKWLNSVIGAQILLGAAAWWSRLATREAPQPEPMTIWLTVAHTVLGALVLASTVVFALVCHRLFVEGRVATVSAVLTVGTSLDAKSPGAN